MLGRIVDYLLSHNVPFRLSSRPSPESLPAVGETLPAGGIAVETWVILVGGASTIVCVPRGSGLSLPRLKHELGADVALAKPTDLAPPYDTATEPIPPFGGAMGATVIVDDSLAQATVLGFEAFSPTTYFEIPYNELALLERPRLASFVTGGELPERSEPTPPEIRP